ncbi:MAG: dockerin type I domain-containing protein [Ruminococcus sp.]|nr:dockerin type I domain-containing protein [Ruminococcus sp.]
MKTKLSKLVAVCLTLAMIFGVFSIVPFSASAAEGDASPTVIGDVDGDGEVTVNDATLIQYYLAELATLNDAQKFVADVDDDGDVTVNDATMIQYYLAELVDGFNKQPAPVEDTVYVVAGTENLTGYNWSGSPDTGNVLEKDGDVYSFTFKNVNVIDEEMQFKIVANKEGSDPEWIGDENGHNIGIKLKEACDITITFDPATKKISVSGQSVYEDSDIFLIDSMRIVGAADINKGTWLNGISWNTAADENLMVEVLPDVYRITFYNLPEEMGYEFKFAANGNWNANWGRGDNTEMVLNTPFDASFNAKNFIFDLEEDSNVTITLDLTGFDFATKSGAKVTIDVEPALPVIMPTYVVAGTPNLTGFNWSGSPDTGHVLEMDGSVYCYTFENVDVLNEEMQIKIVANKQGGDPVWIGDENGQNIAFKVTEVSDVKISFDPATNKITVSGDGVEMITDLVINNIIIAGAADESKGSWLNGVSWAPSAMANIVPMVAPKVYSVKYENLPEEMGYEFKFAVNGTWNANWGIADDTEFEFGTYFDSKFNGSNIKFDLEEKSNVTIVLDLTNFVYATKEGAKINIIVEPVKNYTYVVAGTENLTSYFWSSSVETGNVMTQNEDGTYSFTFKDVAASDEEMQLKIVGIPAEGGDIVWYGVDGTSANVAFYNRMDCDITVTFDPETKDIGVTGEGVELITDLVIDSITVAGSGSEPWLNGISWNPTAVENHMTEISDGIYQIRFENIQSELNYELKFAANDSWGNNWGIPTGASYTPGEWADAVINADNIRFEVEDDLAIVVVTLDLTDFSYTTKQGAKFCIEIIPITEE